MKKKQKMKTLPDIFLTRKEIKALRKLTKEHKDANIFVLTQDHTTGIGTNTYVSVSLDPKSDAKVYDITDYGSW